LSIAGILRIVKEMKKAFNDSRRKSIFKIIYELLNYYFKNKDLPRFYFANMIHRKDVINYLDYYIGIKEFQKIRKLVIDSGLVTFLENKVLFYHHYKDSNLKLPKHLGYNFGDKFYFQNGVHYIRNHNSFCNFIEDVMVKNSSSSIFIKPIVGFGGKDCFRIDADMLRPDSLADVYDKIISSKYLFQETMVQHPLISAIYPYSVNTLRIHTCISLNGQIELISIFMKFGSNGKYVEGGGLGTILISVDRDTGELGPYAWKNFEWGGDIFIRHPNTGFEFAGFVVPHLEAAKEMAKAAAAFLPYRLIGWDVAITEEGPILVEGNHDFGFWAGQIADGGFKKNKIFKSFYEELTSESK
jgi:hypothetical protein